MPTSFVLASRHENFGMVAAEAAAAGTPSVSPTGAASQSCSVDEAPSSSRTSRRRCGTRSSASSAMPSCRRTLGVGGREVAGEHSWARIAELQEQIYRRGRCLSSR